MPEDIYEALFEFQKDPPALTKDADNPFFSSKYIPLEQVVERVFPVLHKLGVLVTQSGDHVGDAPALRTTLMHVPSKTEVSGTMPLIMDKVTPQAQGSALTYLRRYALLSVLGLVADRDDDGESATAPSRVKKTKPADLTNAGSVINSPSL